MKKLMLFALSLALIVSLAGCAGSRAFQRGERYSQRGELDLAVKEYRDALRSSPQDIQYRSALLRAEEAAANQHYKRARDYLKERKLDLAIIELQQAVFLNPTNAAIQGALKTVLNMKQAEEHYRASLTFVELNRLGDAINELSRAVELDPENPKYQDTLDKLQKKKSEIEPDEALTLASDKPITLNFKNTNIKEVFELMSKLSGINILFDEEVRAQPVTIFVKDVSFQYALNLLLSTNKLFMKKISADTIIIVPKTKPKMDQYQDLVMKTFYLNNARAKDAVNLLRSMLDTRKVYVNEVLNSITVRETPEKVKLVEKIIAANDLKEAEVILDVEILEIARTNSLSYGWNFQPGLVAGASVQGTALGTGSPATAGITQGITLNEFRNLSGDNIILTLPSLLLTLIKQDSDAQTLANPRVRVLNNKQAKFHIGERIPIQTSTVQSTTTIAVTSTFEYKDVGIKLAIEPIIHLNNTVSLKMNLEISNLGEAIDFGNGQKQYKFGTRSADTSINLRDGETVIIGGLIKDEERKTRNSIPLLGDLPVIGKLFSRNDDGTVKTDILMSITPNIVRTMELPDKDLQSFWSGTEEAYDVKPLFVTGTAKSSKPAERAVDKVAVLDALAKRDQQAAPKPAEDQAGAPQEAVSAVVQLELKPEDATALLGQDLRFDVAASNVKDLYGAIITLGYDPRVVDFRSATEGPLLKKDGQQTSFLFSNNIKAGTVDLYITRIGDVGGVEGAGDLFTVVFQAKTAGSGPIQFKSVKMGNSAREPFKVETKNGKVTIK